MRCYIGQFDTDTKRVGYIWPKYDGVFGPITSCALVMFLHILEQGGPKLASLSKIMPMTYFPDNSPLQVLNYIAHKRMSEQSPTQFGRIWEGSTGGWWPLPRSVEKHSAPSSA